jgi:predicted ATPase
LKTSLEIGNQLFTLAHRQSNPARLVGGYLALGMTFFFQTKLSDAGRELERGISLYYEKQFPALSCCYGESDAGVLCLVYASATLWLLGFPEQAQQRHEEALKLARGLANPYSLALTLAWSARLYQYRRDILAVYDQAVAVMDLATKHGFASWLPQGMYLCGWSLALQGHVKEGIIQIQQGLNSKRATGSKRDQECACAFLAEAYGEDAQPDKGLHIIVEAIDFVDMTDERTWEAELHRLKGQLLLQQSPDNATEAETCFQKAISIAQNQSAKSWELRAATSLAKLWQRQGKRQEAYDLLAPVYSWFTEGFDTADLIDAKALLDELAKETPREAR